MRIDEPEAVKRVETIAAHQRGFEPTFRRRIENVCQDNPGTWVGGGKGNLSSAGSVCRYVERVG
jgi:hypothetical protein